MARATDDLRTGDLILMEAADLYLASPRADDGARSRVLDTCWVVQQLVDRVLEHSTDDKARRLAETFRRGPIPDYTDESKPFEWPGGG